MNARVDPTPETISHRRQKMAEVISLYPDKFARIYERHQDSVWLIGRLFIAGVITREQRDAAEQYQRVARNYEMLLEGPRVSTLRDGGKSLEDEESYTKRFKRTKRRYETMHHALMEQGMDVAKAVAQVLRDEHADIQLLKQGLDALENA